MADQRSRGPHEDARVGRQRRVVVLFISINVVDTDADDFFGVHNRSLIDDIVEGVIGRQIVTERL